MFAPIQGGLYNGSQVEAAVALAREAGLVAVGQSSWGPTVFGFAANSEQAEWAVTKLQRDGGQDWSVTIAQPAQHGAELRWLNS